MAEGYGTSRTRVALECMSAIARKDGREGERLQKAGRIVAMLSARHMSQPIPSPALRRRPISWGIAAILGTAWLTSLCHAQQPATTPASPPPTASADAGLVFLLQPDAKASALVDRTGRFTPTVSGGEIIHDATDGAILKLGSGDKNGITVKDDGKLQFQGGMTLEAWVCFDEPPPPRGASFAMKVGSFSWDVQKAKLNTSWLVFPSEEIFTTTPQQFKYYPVGGDMINGFMNVPMGKWTRLTCAYDEALGSVTTRIDGMVDRQRYRYRGPQPMQCDGRSAITLLQGYKNCRVREIRLRTGRPQLTPPSLEVYVNALPYRGKMQITFDHIDPALPLPIVVTVVWEKASGSAETVRTLTLDSHEKQELLLDAPTWLNSLHTVSVHAISAGSEVFAKNFRVANVKPAGATMLHADHTISRDGKPFFPLMVYHAMPEDFAKLSELGFNILFNDFNLNRHAPGDPEKYTTLLKQSLDAAQENKLLFITATNSTFNKLRTIPVAKDHPAMLCWYGADEPWGDLTRLSESYNTIKMLEPNLPVLIIQNNYSRLQDTASGADILATDPYPVPNVSLRAVADATESSIRAVSNRKPVWSIIPQYVGKVPTREELRCMAWIAIASGADGLGFFDWDERTVDPQTGALKGWYTKEHPEQVEDLRVVLAELRSLEAQLLLPDAEVQPVAASANPAVHALVKQGDGRNILFLANDSRREESVTLKFEGVADGEARCLSAGDKNAKVDVRDGAATITLPPLGVGVYELKRPAASR